MHRENGCKWKRKIRIKCRRIEVRAKVEEEWLYSKCERKKHRSKGKKENRAERKKGVTRRYE